LKRVASVLVVLVLAGGPAAAQGIDMSHGGPVEVTSRDGIEWRQNDQEIIARGDARAIRDNVTVTADELIAHYRKKAGTAAPAPTSAGEPDDAGANEIYRLEANGNVHIFTVTDQAWGDHAVYDMDKAVLVMTGRALRLTTPDDVITARDSLEYWSQTRMSVARGNAVLVTNDARRIAADTLVGFSEDPNAGVTKVAAAPPKPGADPLMSAGKLQRVEAFGNVDLRTPTETVYGDRGVYVPDTGMSRVVGHVRVTRGQNQLNGVAADVNMKTGIATMLSSAEQRVHGLIVPNDAQGDANRGANPGAKAR
jgi:lipopolysaccharide export system protein LptA